MAENEISKSLKLLNDMLENEFGPPQDTNAIRKRMDTIAALGSRRAQTYAAFGLQDPSADLIQFLLLRERDEIDRSDNQNKLKIQLADLLITSQLKQAETEAAIRYQNALEDKTRNDIALDNVKEERDKKEFKLKQKQIKQELDAAHAQMEYYQALGIKTRQETEQAAILFPIDQEMAVANLNKIFAETDEANNKAAAAAENLVQLQEGTKLMKQQNEEREALIDNLMAQGLSRVDAILAVATSRARTEQGAFASEKSLVKGSQEAGQDILKPQDTMVLLGDLSNILSVERDPQTGETSPIGKAAIDLFLQMSPNFKELFEPIRAKEETISQPIKPAMPWSNAPSFGGRNG